MTKPITPEEARHTQRNTIPNGIFVVFNKLISKNYSNGYATVYQEDVVKALEAKGFNIDKVFKNRWLDIEEVYEEYGWEVGYDSPVGYAGENFKAYYTFKEKKA